MLLQSLEQYHNLLQTPRIVLEFNTEFMNSPRIYYNADQIIHKIITKPQDSTTSYYKLITVLTELYIKLLQSL